jgi:predicted SAM-dependent methyltransferase
MRRVNLGAGSQSLPGYENRDIKQGQQCYPLPDADGSLDEIRASHVLEHLTFREVCEALRDWSRALKPGGTLKVAVPDVDKALAADDGKRLFYLMGGQTDEHDIHRSAYDAERLEAVLADAGFAEVANWQSCDPDTSSHPISLNRQCKKPAAVQQPRTATVRVGAYCTHPRYEAVAARNIIDGALKRLKIDLHCSQGVFWGQCMQRMFTDAVQKGLDWILSIDSDSLFTHEHVRHLLDVFAQTPEADAMAALQCRRGSPFPLLTTGVHKEGDTIKIDGKPIKVATAHFGLTLIRVASLKQVSKPWFKAEPSKTGEWDDDKLDDDIYFWHAWRQAGKTIFVAPSCSIGHLEETVAMFDENMQPQHVYVHEWRKKVGLS